LSRKQPPKACLCVFPNTRTTTCEYVPASVFLSLLLAVPSGHEGGDVLLSSVQLKTATCAKPRSVCLSACLVLHCLLAATAHNCASCISIRRYAPTYSTRLKPVVTLEDSNASGTPGGCTLAVHLRALVSALGDARPGVCKPRTGPSILLSVPPVGPQKRRYPAAQVDGACPVEAPTTDAFGTEGGGRPLPLNLAGSQLTSKAGGVRNRFRRRGV
jgi:hypothetical protein